MKKPLVVDVIELTSSSDEETPPLVPKMIGRSKEKGPQGQLPSYMSLEDDGAILVLYVEFFPECLNYVILINCLKQRTKISEKTSFCHYAKKNAFKAAVQERC
jgi:hypothetical protein